jgi:hypothetical protein
MRLLTGISPDRQILYTHTPSEPILVLGAADILYGSDTSWSPILDTFNKRLCESGLIEKGLIGELAARILLLIARDFAAPGDAASRKRDILKLVPLLAFFDQLFGVKTWCGEGFRNTFLTAYVNFTHWVVTKDALPMVPDE